MKTTRQPAPFDQTALPQDPSPEEIRKACRNIRREWSASERRKRASWQVQPWMVPIVRNNEPWV